MWLFHGVEEVTQVFQTFDVFFFFFFFVHVSKEKIWDKAFLMVPTRDVKSKQADAGVTFTANECNIWFFITALPKSINRTQYKDQ